MIDNLNHIERNIKIISVLLVVECIIVCLLIIKEFH